METETLFPLVTTVKEHKSFARNLKNNYFLFSSRESQGDEVLHYLINTITTSVWHVRQNINS